MTTLGSTLETFESVDVCMRARVFICLYVCVFVCVTVCCYFRTTYVGVGVSVGVGVGLLYHYWYCKLI